MAKKSKKSKKRTLKKPPVVRLKGAAGWIAEQKVAFSEGKGHRASVLGGRLFEDDSLSEPVRQRFFAAGHEAHLRTLVANDEIDQSQSRAKKLLADYEWVGEFFALSFQLRFGIVEVEDERGWLDRLRAELVDVSDLCGVEALDLGKHAQSILDAWSLVESGDDAAALVLLKRVGRRSPLVDWRLFVQVLIAVGQRNLTEARSVIKRMLSGCPARTTAEAFVVAYEQNDGTYTRRIRKLINSAEDNEIALPTIEPLIRCVLADGRPALALALMTSAIGSLSFSPKLKFYIEAVDRMRSDGFSNRHIDIRMVTSERFHSALFDENGLKAIRDDVWSEKEMVRLWIYFFQQVKDRWDELLQSSTSWQIDMEEEDFLHPFIKDCRWITKKLPAFHEGYKFWIWLETTLKQESLRGIQAYIKAFPTDVDVLTLAVTLFGKAGEFKKAETCLSSLTQVGESADVLNTLRQWIIFKRVENAFEKDDITKVEKWGAAYSGQQFTERILVTFMRWRLATTSNKRKLGIELTELKSPWLVLFYATDHDVKLPKLPAGIKRSFTDDPSAVLRGFLHLFEREQALVVKRMTSALLNPLIKALNHPETSLDLFLPVLSALLFRMKNKTKIVSSMENENFLCQQLLAGGANDQALALALRVLIIFIWLDDDLREDKVERTMRVAWSLSTSNEVRALISRVTSQLKILPKTTLKKPATKKMIHAELKMQLKFKTFQILIDRYEQSFYDGPFNKKFESRSYIERIIEELEEMDRFEEEEG